MTCPKCEGKIIVLDTRSDCDAVYRRRKCVKCGYVFFTEECEHIDAAVRFHSISNEIRVKRKMKGSNQNA